MKQFSLQNKQDIIVPTFHTVDIKIVAGACTLHCKKRLSIFSSPPGKSLTKLSLAENNKIMPDRGEFG